jgi:REP element-mobilizing transposase RayT
MIKGNLSRQLSLNYPELLERNRTKTPWAKGYFARSSGKADVETALQYVADQAAHHGYCGELAIVSS